MTTPTAERREAEAVVRNELIRRKYENIPPWDSTGFSQAFAFATELQAKLQAYERAVKEINQEEITTVAYDWDEGYSAAILRIRRIIRKHLEAL